MAKPGDTTRRDTGWHRDESETGWEMLFGSSPADWRPVDVRAWWTDDHGRSVAQIEWHAEMSTWTGEFLAAADLMRETPRDGEERDASPVRAAPPDASP